MKILLLAPTELELNAIKVEHQQLDKRVCGVGGINLARYLIPFIEKDAFDITILAGLAGGLKEETNLGEVTKVAFDHQGDLGVFENNGYIPFEKSGLTEPSSHNNEYNLVDDVMSDLKIVNALSTNTLFEDNNKNELRHSYFKTQIENMEGAAFQEICEEYETPYLQIRAISNYIGERDKDNWVISEALENLNKTLTDYINSVL